MSAKTKLKHLFFKNSEDAWGLSICEFRADMVLFILFTFYCGETSDSLKVSMVAVVEIKISELSISTKRIQAPNTTEPFQTIMFIQQHSVDLSYPHPRCETSYFFKVYFACGKLYLTRAGREGQRCRSVVVEWG